jgi:hypothetical protein
MRDSMEAGEAAIKSKTKTQAKSKQASADLAAELQDTSVTRNDDANYLADIVAKCQSKTAESKSRQQLRVEEVESLTKVIEIISSSAVAGAAEANLPKAAALQLRAQPSTALAQLRARMASRPADNDKLKAVVALFLEASTRLGSHVLSALAVRAQEDPFAKVKQLIQGLIDQLMQQAAEEADHKGWCDTELATNERTRTTKSEEIETLTAEVDKLNADIAILKKDIAELSKALAQLNADMAKETQLRKTEKAQNERTLQESRDAQSAVSEAMSLLQTFYAKANDATVFAQSNRRVGLKQEPPIFDAAYKGLQDKTDGVLGMMEVIRSDFARLERRAQF